MKNGKSLINVRLGSTFWFSMNKEGTYKKIGELIGGEDEYYEVRELERGAIYIVYPEDIFELIKY